MKKRLLFFIVVVVATVATGYNIYFSQFEVKLSDLALANVEALAQNESNPNKQSCYKKWRKASSQDALAVWDWICQECESYWLLNPAYKSECNK